MYLYGNLLIFSKRIEINLYQYILYTQVSLLLELAFFPTFIILLLQLFSF